MIWNDTKSVLLWIAVGDGDALSSHTNKDRQKNGQTGG